MSNVTAIKPGLLERLAEGPVICAEGYVFELERRGYVTAGPYVPDVVLEHPDAVTQLHRDFLRAGSDVMEAFTYYGHREKLRNIGKEDLLEELNRQAIRIARAVAAEGGALVAGDICNTNVFDHEDEASKDEARAIFEEQVMWAAEEGVDFIVAETFSYCEEALLALDVVKRASLPAVVTMAVHHNGVTREGMTPADCCKVLEDAGADVVGLNCARGPATMLPMLRAIREAVSCHVAALPVPYRTTEAEPTFQTLRDPCCQIIPEGRPFPTALDPFTCNRYEIAAFTGEAQAMGVNYLGLCCGAAPHHVRSMAEALGRRPPASEHSPDMAKHSFYGTAETVRASYRAYANEL